MRSEQIGSRLATSLMALAVIWAAAVPFAAWRMATPGGGRWAATIVYVVGAGVCHQRPERSFQIAGVALPVCGRCTGLYLSAGVVALIGLVIGLRRVPAAGSNVWRAILIVAALPTLISWGLERLGGGDPGNLVRAVCAIPLGAAAAAALAAVRRANRQDT